MLQTEYASKARTRNQCKLSVSDNSGVQNHILIAFTEVFMLTAGFGNQVEVLAFKVYNNKVCKCTKYNER